MSNTTAPLNGWDIIGHGEAVARLQRLAAGGRAHHAYLLTGPAGVGKRTLAERATAALLCERDDGPCQRCRQCSLRLAGNHPDYHALPAEGSLTIAMVRDLKQALALKPHTATRRVGLIANAERLAAPAQNALLKLLEEPPPDAILILTASQSQALLPTTVSRCQQIALGLPTEDELREYFADQDSQGKVPGLDMEALIRLSGRRPGRAVTLAEDPSRLALQNGWGERLRELLAQPPAQRLREAPELADGERLAEVLDHWIWLHREALHGSLGGAVSGPGSGDDQADVANWLAARQSPHDLTANLRLLVAARQRLGYNPNVQLLVEHTLMNLSPC